MAYVTPVASVPFVSERQLTGDAFPFCSVNHQRQISNFLFGRLEMITGLHQNLLAKRPYFIFWVRHPV